MEAQREAQRISPQEAREKLERNEALFIDARNPQAFSESNVRIPNATRMLASEASEHIHELPRDKEIITYCT